jgi:hypothetical protein
MQLILNALPCREEVASGAEKEQLAALCRKLITMREGFGSCCCIHSFNSCSDKRAHGMTRMSHCSDGTLAANEEEQQLQLRTEGLDDASLLQLGARWRALTADARTADAILSPEAAQLAERQACMRTSPAHVHCCMRMAAMQSCLLCTAHIAK